MSGSTVYDVRVRYALDDKASKGLGGVALAADKASQKTMSLKGALLGVGVAAAGILTLGKRALIDYNANIDKMKIGLTTVLQMQLHKPFERAKEEAALLFKNLQEIAKKSPATTQQFIEMANQIAPAVAASGGGIDKIQNLAEGGMIASQALGIRQDVAGLDIKQMLQGTVTERDMMANQLIMSQGMTKEAFNAMDPAKRAAKVEEIFQNPALKKAAEEFGQSFVGQASTFSDQLQIALGQVGKPLMASLTEEVKRWNTWIEKHPKTIAKISEQIGGMIKNTFTFVRNVVGWLVDHRDMIMMVAKTFLVFKGAQLATNIFKSFVTGVTGLLGQIKTAGSSLMGVIGGGSGGLTGGFKGLIGVLSGAGGVIPVFGGLIAAGIGLWDTLTKINDSEADRARRMDFDEAIAAGGTRAQRLAEIDNMMAQKYDANGNIMRQGDFGALPADQQARILQEKTNLEKDFANPESTGAIVRSMSDTLKKHGLNGFEGLSPADLGSKNGMGFNLFESLYADNPDAKKLIGEIDSFYVKLSNLTTKEKEAIFQAAFPEQFGMPVNQPPAPTDYSQGWGGGPTKADVKVTINKIEVASEDPDRFVFGMVKAVENVAKNPTQAASAIVGGF